jgi:hypothetical protein
MLSCPPLSWCCKRGRFQAVIVHKVAQLPLGPDDVATTTNTVARLCRMYAYRVNTQNDCLLSGGEVAVQVCADPIVA